VTSFNSSFTCTDDFNPLPIQLSSFRAVPSNGAIRLDWTTLSELNNYGFFVERREGNSPTFVELAGSFLAGHGTTNEPQSYTWTDETSSPGVWYYRLKQMDLDGSISFCDPVRVELPTGVTESQPVMFTLMQNYPNPFNPTTTIEFSLPEKNATTLRVYDVLGREVAALVDGMLQAGRYAKSLDANRLSSGMYFYVLRSGRLQSTRTMMLLK
jgi:hypothetical protein